MLETRPPMTAGPIERALSAVGSTIAPESTPVLAAGVGLPSKVFFFGCCARSAPGSAKTIRIANKTDERERMRIAIPGDEDCVGPAGHGTSPLTHGEVYSERH